MFKKGVDMGRINRYTEVLELVSVTAFVEALFILSNLQKKLNLGTDAQ